MARKQKEAKAAQKTYRITARTAFASEACAQLEKKNETEVAETAIQKHARRIFRLAKLSLDETYHPNAGVRWCRLYARHDIAFDDAHERRRAFVFEHRAFFMRRGADGKLEVHVPNVEVLCPGDITQLDKWRELGAGNYWEPGRAMAKALDKRGLAAPVWPPRKEKP